MSNEGERIRLVVMGDRKVGKTCLIRQFLYTTFQDKYKPTIEDLYSEDFSVGESKLKVDFLDTAGDVQFPVMRRLSITSGHAFLLIYSVTDPVSLEFVQRRLDEIKTQRVDFKDLPIVIAGNKVDLANEGREIFVEDVIDWVSYTIPSDRLRVVECSARDTFNVNTVFKTFLELANIPVVVPQGLRRGASAYAKLRLTSQTDANCKSLHKRIRSLKFSTNFSGEKRRPRSTSQMPLQRSSGNGSVVLTTTASPMSSLPSSPLTDCSSPSPRPHSSSSPVFDFNVKLWKKGEKQFTDDQRMSERKPRSRSLNRRSSNKIRRKVNETKPDECLVS